MVLEIERNHDISRHFANVAAHFQELSHILNTCFGHLLLDISKISFITLNELSNRHSFIVAIQQFQNIAR